MTASILDGSACAATIRETIRRRVALHQQTINRVPGLAVIILGENPASQIYVRGKRRACDEVGFHSRGFDLPETTSEAELLALIEKLNQDAEIDGILVQLPLPVSIDSAKILDHICPKKDVDGFHPLNLGKLAQRRPGLRPCTPHGVMTLLKAHGIEVTGLNATVVGASNIVGRPMALELLLGGATVTTCHRFTQNLESHVRRAELLVVAIGKTDIIKGEWITPGTIVIDVGMNRLANGKLVGDVPAATARENAAWITPVPGGVGPMTIAMLLENTLQSFEEKINET